MRYAVNGNVLKELPKLSNWGISEYHYDVPFDSGIYVEALLEIRKAGMVPILAELTRNRGPDEASPGTSHFQTLNDAGWHGIAGEGVSADIVRDVMQVMPYYNLGKMSGGIQVDVYKSPWNHPNDGNYGHADYITIYADSDDYIRSCKTCIKSAKINRTRNCGITIPAWMTGIDLTTYSYLIYEASGVDTIMVRSEYDVDPWKVIRQISGLKNIYGVIKSRG